MRFAVVALLALAASASAKGGQGKKDGGKGGDKKVTADKKHTGSKTTGSKTTGSKTTGSKTTGGASSSSSSSSGILTLDKNLVQTASFATGHNASAAGQADSLTDKANFINFCKGKTLTNGAQVLTGSCNGIVMGDIPSTKNMVAAKFQFPRNFDSVAAFKDFTVKVKINGLKTGTFVNAKANYYAAPAQVGSDGRIIGHTHIVIDKVNGFQDTTVADPLKFAFFKGIDAGADGQGVNSVVVVGGLPEGTYRLATINTAANHQPVLMPVAQHTSVDDMVYFTVKKNGKRQNSGRRHHEGAHEHDR